MTFKDLRISLFTKPWKSLSLPELAAHVKSMGMNGVELPVRPGFQVEPANVRTALPEAVKVMADHGLKIFSIGSDPLPEIIEACGSCGVGILRTMPKIETHQTYLEAEGAWRNLYSSLVPVLKDHGVRLGVQQHAGPFISSAAGILRLIENLPPEQVGAVWDPAHCSLAGERPEYAADILWKHLCMVNMKNAIWRRVTGPEAEEVKWDRYWTSGKHGLTSWSEVARVLHTRGFKGIILHFAEYADHDSVDRLTKQDMDYLCRTLGKYYERA